MSCVHWAHGAPVPKSVNEGEGGINSLKSQWFNMHEEVGAGTHMNGTKLQRSLNRTGLFFFLLFFFVCFLQIRHSCLRQSHYCVMYGGAELKTNAWFFYCLLENWKRAFMTQPLWPSNRFEHCANTDLSGYPENVFVLEFWHFLF